MPKKGSGYAQQPLVPAKKIAGTNPKGSVAVGSKTPPTVPKPTSGFPHGFGPQVTQFGHPSVTGRHGFGHIAKEHHGHLRLSGHVGAHRIGGVKLPKK